MADVAPRPQESVGPGFVGVVAASAAFLFYTALDGYAADAWGLPPPIVYVLATVAFGLVAAALHPERLIPVARSPIFLWMVAFFFVTALWGAFIPGTKAVRDEFVDRFRMLGQAGALLVIFHDARVRRAAVLAIAAGIVLGCLLNVLESLNLVTLADNSERVLGRAAGLYVNPNGSGSILVLGVAAVAPELPRRVLFVLLGLTGIAVALTFSRGSAMGFGLLLVLLAATRIVKVGPLVALAFLAGAALVYYSGDVTRLLETNGVLNSNTWARLQLSHDDSGRLDLARRAWALFANEPLVGNGLGSTSEWDLGQRPHNQYLLYAADHGIVGLLLYPALALAIVVASRSAIPFAISMLLQGFFSHNLVTSRSIIVLLALVGSTAAVTRSTAERA